MAAEQAKIFPRNIDRTSNGSMTRSLDRYKPTWDQAGSCRFGLHAKWCKAMISSHKCSRWKYKIRKCFYIASLEADARLGSCSNRSGLDRYKSQQRGTYVEAGGERAIGWNFGACTSLVYGNVSNRYYLYYTLYNDMCKRLYCITFVFWCLYGSDIFFYTYTTYRYIFFVICMWQVMFFVIV